MDTKKLIWIIAVGSLFLGVFNFFFPHLPNKALNNDLAGATGNLLIEQYDPYVLYNSGIKTALDIDTTANIGISTTSTSQDLNIGAGGSATSTIDAGKACFRFTQAGGQVVYYWPMSTSTAGMNAGWATSTVSCF